MDLLNTNIIDGQELKNLDYSGKTLRDKEFIDTRFVRCHFNDTLFEECQFKDCVFKDCDLTMMRVEASRFSSVTFEGCKAVGINWTEASWEKAGLFRLIDFENCTLNYSSFFGLKMKKMKLVKCTVHEVDFGEADLTGVSFASTDLTGSIFMHTNLTEADFSRATNYSISPALNTLKKTRFALPEAMSLLYSLDIILTDEKS